MNSQSNTNTTLTVEAWAEITIKEWVKKADALEIGGEKMRLAPQRFMHHVITNANGDPEKIVFMYDYWLNFIDWGVGKGVLLTERDSLVKLGKTKRTQRQWFTSVFYLQVRILAEEMAKKYAQKAANIFINKSLLDDEGKIISARDYSRENNRKVDRHTGKTKVTRKQFDENRKNSGW